MDKDLKAVELCLIGFVTRHALAVVATRPTCPGFRGELRVWVLKSSCTLDLQHYYTGMPGVLITTTGAKDRPKFASGVL